MPDRIASVRWGILGTSRIAEKFINGVRAQRAGEIAVIASRDPARGAAYAQRLQIPRLVHGYETLLQDPLVDAVYLPLPTGDHALWAKRAVEAGKPVLVEKPFATSAAEAEPVFAAAAARGVILGEAAMYRFHPLNRRMVQLVQDGLVGPAELVRASFTVGIDPGDHRWKRSAGGGAWLDLGYYTIGMARWLMGSEPLSATGHVRWGGPAGDQVDVTSAATLAFSGNRVAVLLTSMESAFDCSYEVIGRTGRLRVDRGGMVAWPGSPFTIERWGQDGVVHEEIPAADAYGLMAHAFAEAVAGGHPYPIGQAETLANLRALDLVRRGLVNVAAATG